MTARALGLAVMLTLVTAGTAFAQKKEADLPDTVHLRGNRKIKCTVTREDPKELVFKDARDKEQKVSWDDVERIEYRDFPGEITQAEAALEQRNYTRADAAAEEAVRASTDGRGKDLFLARARVAKARALRALNRYGEAATAAEQALDAAGGTRWARDAYIVRVDALAAKGDESCVKVGEEAESKADVFGEEFKYDIYLLVGDYLCLKKKDASAAKAKYAFAQNSNRAEVLERAKLGLARVKLLEKNEKGAIDAYREIERTARDAYALAGACIGLGDATMLRFEKASKADEKAVILREALTFYLRGAVMAVPTGGSSSENHEDCLVKAAQTAEKIAATIEGKKEKDLAAKKFFVDYARKIYEDTYRQYPASDSAEKYKEQITKLKAESIKLSPDKPAADKKD